MTHEAGRLGCGDVQLLFHRGTEFHATHRDETPSGIHP